MCKYILAGWETTFLYYSQLALTDQTHSSGCEAGKPSCASERLTGPRAQRCLLHSWWWSQEALRHAALTLFSAHSANIWLICSLPLYAKWDFSSKYLRHGSPILKEFCHLSCYLFIYFSCLNFVTRLSIASFWTAEQCTHPSGFTWESLWGQSWCLIFCSKMYLRNNCYFSFPYFIHSED